MKVFVSSTYEDLKEHRLAVRDAILRLGHHPICMEDFGSKPVEPKVAALDKLAESDVLVGIYAYRYGTIPKGDSKSITEQEFDKASEWGLPCFCYRVDEDAPWPPKYSQGKHKKKREAFLKKVDKYLRSQFTDDPNHLAKQVAADLKRELPTEIVELDINPNCFRRLKEIKRANRALVVAMRVVRKLESSYAKEVRLRKPNRSSKRKKR